MKKLRTKGEWTYELLHEYFDEIEKIAIEEFGLDGYPCQLEVITSQQMLDAYSTHALPVMYDHWRFGKSYIQNEKAYNQGRMGLAYEIVSNTNPCIAYLMEENSIMMQALVMAHACFGHNYVFKHNYMFKDWTDASSIIDYLIFAKKYIKHCEDQYGTEEVEDFLDAAHALELYGVDKYKRSRSGLKLSEHQKHLESVVYKERHYDDVISSTLPKPAPSEKTIDEKFKEFENMEPEENILYFLEKKAPYLQDWQKEILRIVRKVSQYFYPQRFCRLVHEGFACMVHYQIMNRLYEKGLVDDGFMLEFFDSHSAVVSQPGFDHPYYNQIGVNVYALGFHMLMDVKRICMDPTEEDKEYFHWAGNGDWINTIKNIAKNYRDESFIQQYLSPKIVRDFKMFRIFDGSSADTIKITDIHNKEGFYQIRDTLAKMFDITVLLPNIQIYKVDVQKRLLHLRHISQDKKYLDEDETVKVINYLGYIWMFDIVLESIDSNGVLYDKYEYKNLANKT